MASNDLISKIPLELVDIIIDFVNYKKYEHIPLLEKVLIDIHRAGSLFDINENIQPYVAYMCWGRGLAFHCFPCQIKNK